MKVQNMTGRTGRPVTNQFIISGYDNCDDWFEIFQSYDSVIARRDKSGVTLDSYYWDYSVTTGKYRNEFLGEGINETRRKIDSGEYRLANLNG